MPPPIETADRFTTEEAQALAPYFTNVDRPIFALTNLPETVKGAMFARYSRSKKSLRRLFLDEFKGDVPSATVAGGASAGTARADQLYTQASDAGVAQMTKK